MSYNANLTPQNIKSGVNVGGIVGTFDGKRVHYGFLDQNRPNASSDWTQATHVFDISAPFKIGTIIIIGDNQYESSSYTKNPPGFTFYIVRFPMTFGLRNSFQSLGSSNSYPGFWVDNITYPTDSSIRLSTKSTLNYNYRPLAMRVWYYVVEA